MPYPRESAASVGARKTRKEQALKANIVADMTPQEVADNLTVHFNPAQLRVQLQRRALDTAGTILGRLTSTHRRSRN